MRFVLKIDPFKWRIFNNFALNLLSDQFVGVLRRRVLKVDLKLYRAHSAGRNERHLRLPNSADVCCELKIN